MSNLSEVERRAGVFALWLVHEARANPQMAGVRQMFLDVGRDILDGKVHDSEHEQFLYGAVRGHAKAFGYEEDYEAQPSVYLAYFIGAVVEGAEKK